MRIVMKDFRGWLESKKPDEVVGEAGYALICPVASFIREQHGAFAAVNTSFLRNRRSITLRRFIKAVDMHALGARITARKALEILDRC